MTWCGSAVIVPLFSLACSVLGAPQSATEDLRNLPFGELHAPTGASDGSALILGALKQNEKVSRSRAQLLGRWEGHDLALPVPRDWKVVLFIQEIQGDRGTVVLYAGTNLQRPKWVVRFQVEIWGESPPLLAGRVKLDGVERRFSFRYDSASDRLLGSVQPTLQGFSTGESVVLTRNRDLLVYRDYPAYLAGKRITAHEHQTPALANFGKGYLVYLPPGYETSPERRWPLILFFCGSGDRGAPIEDLAKASPFMFIREHGDLPAIIVAPELNELPKQASFPTEYMQGVLDDLLARYRVDPSRVALTGLSMGGEAALRLALTSPERVAAVAMVSMADPRFDRKLQGWGFQVTEVPYQRVASIPFYVVNGGRDLVISSDAVRQTVEALRAAGVKTEWKPLLDNGHDTWTETYSDPAFYEWILSKRR